MRLWVGIALVAVVLLGVKLRVLSFDPLSILLLAVVIWNNWVIMKRQQTTVDFITKSHASTTANLRDIQKQLQAVQSALRNLRS